MLHEQKVHRVIVNGEQKEVRKEHLTFHDVCELGSSEGSFEDNIVYTVSFSYPDGTEGSMVKHESIEIINGMVFDVTSHAPKYFVCIEGEEVSWDKDTITAEQIAELGGWDIAQGVIEVDTENNERTLLPGECVEIKPGHGFGKKHKWKRG